MAEIFIMQGAEPLAVSNKSIRRFGGEIIRLYPDARDLIHQVVERVDDGITPPGQALYDLLELGASIVLDDVYNTDKFLGPMDGD